MTTINGYTDVTDATMKASNGQGDSNIEINTEELQYLDLCK